MLQSGPRIGIGDYVRDLEGNCYHIEGGKRWKGKMDFFVRRIGCRQAGDTRWYRPIINDGCIMDLVKLEPLEILVLAGVDGRDD